MYDAYTLAVFIYVLLRGCSGFGQSSVRTHTVFVSQDQKENSHYPCPGTYMCGCISTVDNNKREEFYLVRVRAAVSPLKRVYIYI